MFINKVLLVLGITLFHQATITLAQSEDPVLCSVAFPGPSSPDNLCTMEFRPVCAFHFLCMEDECVGSTVGNACGACSQEGYDYYFEGACQGDVEENGENPGLPAGASWCNGSGEPDPNAICTLEYNPVCAYNIDGAEGTTAGNVCQACNQQGFDYYFPGECEDDTEGTAEEESTGEDTEEGGDQIFWCPVPTPEVCTFIYDPVCAYSSTEEGVGDGVTVGNWCIACQEGFDFYTKGACDDGEGSEEEICSEEGSNEEGSNEEGESGQEEGSVEEGGNAPEEEETEIIIIIETDDFNF